MDYTSKNKSLIEIQENKVLKKCLIPDELLNFGTIYMNTRIKEERFYTDEQVFQLPYPEKKHRYSAEWKLRAKSAKLLKKHIELNKLPNSILEIGCGNGWLSNFLAGIPNSEVTGIDVNEAELEQAARVFGKKENLRFCQCDIFSSPFREESFDFIILASVIQYFPDAVILVKSLLPLLKPGGEIHIIDSPFYEKDEVEDAILRSQAYYKNLKAPEMIENYYHHTLNTILKAFVVKIRFHKPSIRHLLSGLLRKKTFAGFPWIIIEKEQA